MNCSKCSLEIEIKHNSLKCRGNCGNHFHLACLSSANKAYKKSLIGALLNIPNLLWFCNDCLPNSTDTLSSHGNDSQPLAHNQTFQSSPSLADLVVNKSQCTKVTGNSPANPQPCTSLQDSVYTISTDSMVSVQQDGSIQMVTDDIETDSMDFVESNAKRRRLSANGVDKAEEYSMPSANGVDKAEECSMPSAPPAPKFTSTNYRCIYLTSFKPSTNENDVIKYAVDQKKRDSTEIMSCKKLLPAKCNMNRISYISFKLTVHKEFYDFYIDNNFWPEGVTAEDFEMRSPKKRHTNRKLRVNPFAVQRPSQIQPKQNASNRFDSHAPHKRHNVNRNHHSDNYSANRDSRSNGNYRSSFSKQKNHQHQFSNHSSRRYHHQNTHQGNNFHRNRSHRMMEPEQLMQLFHQLNWQIKSLLNHR